MPLTTLSTWSLYNTHSQIFTFQFTNIIKTQKQTVIHADTKAYMYSSFMCICYTLHVNKVKQRQTSEFKYLHVIQMF